MKIRNLSKVALAIAISSAVVLEGCKKYDDDITRLEQSINAVKSDLAGLAANYTIKDVQPITGGLRLTLVDGKGNTRTETVTHGTKGADGTNGTNGKDGTNGTNGQDGTNGTNGTDGKSGTIWRISTTGFTWEYSADGESTWVNTGISAKGINGTDGTNGKDGVNGTDGTNGSNGTNGTDGKDGVNGTDGTNGSNGTNGTDGKDGISPRPVVVGGKTYWFIGDTNTNILAFAGEINAVETNNSVTINIVNADGTTVSPIVFYKTQNSITSITYVPKMTIGENGAAVITFPRIVDGQRDETVFQGSALASFKLNPFGVASDKYAVAGFTSAETSSAPRFRSAGNNLADFEVSIDPSTTLGELNIKAKPGTINPFAKADEANKTLNLALVVNNTFAAQEAGKSADYYSITSAYHIAKEEIIDKSELTIEVIDESKSDEQIVINDNVERNYTQFNRGTYSRTWNEAPSTSSNTVLTFTDNQSVLDTKEPIFAISYNNHAAGTAGLDLAKKLKGFFVRNIGSGRLVSMDDNGLGDYTLKFSVPTTYTPANDNQNHNNYITVTPAGVVHVNTLNGGQPNTGAINKTPYVKVDLVPNSDLNKVLVTRYVKLGVSQFGNIVNQGIIGNVEFEMENAGQEKLVSTIDNNSFDKVYSDLSLSGAQFHSTYGFNSNAVEAKDSNGDVVSGITLSSNYNSAQPNNTLIAELDNDVLPGTYTVTAKYTSSNSIDPDVTVTVTVTVKDSKIATLTKKAAMWTTDNKAIIRGLRSGNIWKMEGNIFDLFQAKTFAPGTTNLVNTTYEFEFVRPEGSAGTYYNGLSLNPSSNATAKIILDETIANARTFIGTGKAVTIKVTTLANGVAYKNENFVINFVNPVNPLELKSGLREMTDQEVSSSNSSSVDLRTAVRLTDFTGAVIYNFISNNNTANQLNLVNQYTIGNLGGNSGGAHGLSTRSFVRAENVDGTPYILGSGQSATAFNSDAIWTNNGAVLQAPIYLIYSITITNKFNIGDVPATLGAVTKEVKIKVNPRN